MEHLNRKIIAFFLTCIVLFAGSSFTADMHFCCDKLVDLAVLGKAKPCDEKIERQEERPSKECSLATQECCSSQSFVKSIDENLKNAQLELGTDTFVFLQTFFHTYINLFEGLDTNIVPFRDYDPPWIERDILVLHETFLI
ncbi:HYC_CC_PP family protein [Flagellimonas meridianipacifica]|uniref:Uncharacterized protein n=1 Tax=Flagellimonas meridianipacifica TaxID=1080225 RepID=A0A2T0MF05_9FLAO|nr:hypothetical protein [Allomuricauda pacifica]PRX56155.1 hypothetical protein CLV81_0147 [Allomuricauda pacifica]